MSFPKSPCLVEPLVNNILDVWLTVVKFVTVKFVIVVLFNCAEELIIPAGIEEMSVYTIWDEPDTNVCVSDAISSFEFMSAYIAS